MSKELTIRNLDQHLKPVQIDGVSTPLELSTKTVRITGGELAIDNMIAGIAEVGGDLTLSGDINMTESIKFPDSVSISSNTEGVLTCSADSLFLSTTQHGGTDSIIAIAAADGYDSQISFM